MNKSLLFFCICILIIISYVNAVDIPESKIKLENFKTINSSYHTIDVTDGVYTVAQIHFGNQPEDISQYLQIIKSSQEYDIGKTNSSGRITIFLEEQQYNDATLIVFIDNNREILGYIGLMRQSEKELLTKFNFTKPNGYTVIGRTPLWFLPNKTYQLNWNPDPVYFYPNLTEYYPEEYYPQELKEIIALVRYFWKEPMKTGPSNMGYNNLPVDTQIEFLESEEWTVQCGEIRDIVASYAIISKNILGVKIVNAEQYYPRLEDLTGNTHGVMEIYSPYYEKWILVDPMFGKLFLYNGKYINTDDILALSIDERKNITPIKIAGNSISLSETFGGYYLNQNYYTYYNTINSKTVKYSITGFNALYYKNTIKKMLAVLK